MTKSPPASNQVTDAVTQTNTRVLNDAPAIALATIYQDTARALNEAVQNAVNTQQQSNILAQSGTTQAVMNLLSTNGAGNPTPFDVNNASATPQVLAEAAAPDPAVRTIERVIESATKLELNHAGPWSDAVREIISTVVAALRDLQVVSQEANKAMVRQAATAAVLVSMIKSPDQLEQYKKILELIGEL
jgi:preprotein translocase subunit SecA